MKALRRLCALLLPPLVVGLLLNWLTPVDVPGALWSAIRWFFGLFLITFTLPIWAILLLMLAIPLVFGIGLVLIFVFRRPQRSSPAYTSYTSDDFFGVSWHWSYLGGRLSDETIMPRCPGCKTILDATYEPGDVIAGHITLVCHHCGFRKRLKFDRDTVLDRVKREIDRKIVSGEYKTVEQ